MGITGATLFATTLWLSLRLADTTKSVIKCDHHREQSVATCLQPMLSYANQLQEETGAMQFPIQGGVIFKKLCSIYLEFKDCVASIDCASLSVDAVDASYGYMCGAGYSLFEQHASCFAEVESVKEYVTCKIAASQAISDAQRGGQMSPSYLKELCTLMSDYLTCSRPIIVQRCGEEAWKLVSTVTRDSLGVTMPDCDTHQALKL